MDGRLFYTFKVIGGPLVSGTPVGSRTAVRLKVTIFVYKQMVHSHLMRVEVFSQQITVNILTMYSTHRTRRYVKYPISVYLVAV